MASVFLSYDRDDAERARSIALALEKAGHSVWWDQHIKGGAQYSKEIDKALKAANAVVVLWSEHSVESAWVRDEAAAGRDSGRLVPVRLDQSEPPLGFRQYQTIDLSRWSGRGKPRQLETVLEAIGSLGASEPAFAAAKPVRTSAPAEHERARPNLNWWLITALIIGLLIMALGLLISRPWEVKASVPLVAVEPGGRSADAEALARNLVVKLGSLRSAKTEAVRLIGPAAAQSVKADFVFEAAADEDRNAARGSLALLSGKDRSILWSKDFEAKDGNRAALEQSMAYIAGQVLDCALQASAPSGRRLDERTLKLFLNGCALFGDKYRTDPQAVVPVFLQVIRSAPDFQPAWRKLLLAEALYTRTERNLGRYTPGELPNRIAAARKLNPDIPELYVAQSVLVPNTAYARRAELLERAVRLDPNNPDLLLMRAEFLASIGRMAEVVEDATRAVEFNPLSPGLRSHMIADLTYAGRIDTAQQELRRAEKLWPESPAINDASWRLNSRYGDPRIALSLLRSGSMGPQPMISQTVEAFLVARIDPTEHNIQRAITAAQSRASVDIRSFVDLVQARGEFHREEELYELLLHWHRTDMIGTIAEVYFRPPLRRFRQDPKFMTVAKQIGLIEYWNRSGKWPDFCFEPDLPYDCKAEAAKLAA